MIMYRVRIIIMDNILEQINSPDNLKSLKLNDLDQLSREIREFIISNISKTGGHLAPSLGVVELTLIMHYLFNTPKDKIVWDVGHQAYVHKILTGRKDRFSTIRQYKGISGFPKISESEYDCFGTGHSSTSISAAIGMACARDLANDDYKVIAVIGDGAMTNGLAFEGLNNAGALGKDLIVVLNDNEMSISKNVGALSNYFTTLITAESYNKIKKEIWGLTGKLSGIGRKIRRVVSRLDESLKAIVVPGLFFEKLGFRYFGPIDGHDIHRLARVFRLAKVLKGPMLIHVVTRKGKGYAPAEENAPRFHGLGAFDKATGSSLKIASVPSYTEIFGKTLAELGHKNKKIIGITAAMSLGTGLIHFANEHPDRFFDVGIAEGHAVTFAAGLASQGFRPVVAIYSSFLQRAFDHVIHDVALQKLPVIFALDRAGVVGDDGPTHHGVFDLSYLRSIPDLVIMSPRDEQELRDMMYTALEYKDGPIAIRYPRGCGTGVKTEQKYKELIIGKSEVIRQGHDAALIAIGPLVSHCIEAREILKQQNISVQVVNARFLKPLDEDMLTEIFKEFPLVVTIEDNTLKGGFGSAVDEFFTKQEQYNSTLINLGIPDQFVEHASMEQLYELVGLDAKSIAESVKKKYNEIQKIKQSLKKMV